MKRRGIAVRIAAAVLAVGMILTDVSPTLAAETIPTESEVSVEQDINGSVSGVSKVIGLTGEPSTQFMYSDDKMASQRYVYRYENIYDKEYIVSGKVADYYDSSIALYRYGNDVYTYARQEASSMVCFKYKVVWYSYVAKDATAVEREKAKPKRDQTTGLYNINGTWYADYDWCTVYEKDVDGNSNSIGTVYYVCESEEVETYTLVSETSDILSELEQRATGLYGRKLKDADKKYAYYDMNGIKSKNAYIKYTGAYDSSTGKVSYKSHCVYFFKRDVISFERCNYKLSWNTVTNDTEVESNGAYLNVGYQVKINGQMATLDMHAINGTQKESITTDAEYVDPQVRSAGETVNYEVRAVYYTTTDNVTRNPQTQAEESNTENTIVKTGEWSNVYTYAWSGSSQCLPTVTNLTVKQKNAKTAELSWDKVPGATGYRLEYYETVEAAEDPQAFKTYWYSIVHTTANKPYYEFDNRDMGNALVKNADGTKVYKPYNYRYVRVYAETQEDGNTYVSSRSVASQVVCIARNRAANTPTINNLKAEQQSSGCFHLKWDGIDTNANVRIYYSTDKSVFDSQEYLYNLIAAEGIDNMGTETTSDDKRVKLVDTYSIQDKLKIVNKKVDYIDCSAGVNEVCSDKFNLDIGKKYYFVVVTYDTVNNSTDRSATTPYVANVARVAGETRNVAFGYYNDVVASKVVSGKAMLELSEPSTTSGKTSIAMTFSSRNETKCTGFQIYRKSGKKYKKIATTNSAYYKDENLKQNTVYDYKVRSYYYNPDTKVTAYSDYVYFSAETSNSNNIALKIEKKSKTSVKLSWTKVPGATRYEIYRSNTSSTDTTYAQKNGYGNGEYALSNTKWDLVKTIKKAGTTSYTDKKLKTGQNYSYRVVAYYKSGKKEKYIFDTDSIELALTAPRDVNAVVSGNTVKVSWKKDTYASKYEVSYIKSDADGNECTDDWVRVITKKTSYTIKNVGAGESVEIRVRAYGSKKWSYYSSAGTEKGKQLAAVQKVTAKEITETSTNGTKTTAVKISWKKVSGAAYYKVFRTMSAYANYNDQTDTYKGPQGTYYYISKESSSDENNSYSGYKEYKGQNATIVGTSAVDRARLKTGVTYYYYVCAYSHDGERISEGYTKPASVCYKATPSIKKITAKKGKTVVSINKVSGAKKYVIYRSTKKSSGYKQIGTTTKTTYTDKTTKKDKIYYYKVVAVGKNALKADFESAKSKAVKVKAK